jgi:hypothetical protein
MQAASDAEVYFVIPPFTPQSGNVVIPSGGVLGVSVGASLDDGVFGVDTQTLAILDMGADVDGTLFGLGSVVLASASSASGVSDVGELLVLERGRPATITGNVSGVGTVKVLEGGHLIILGDLEFEALVLEANVRLEIGGDVSCGPGATIDVAPSAQITLGGATQCDAMLPALPASSNWIVRAILIGTLGIAAGWSLLGHRWTHCRR